MSPTRDAGPCRQAITGTVTELTRIKPRHATLRHHRSLPTRAPAMVTTLYETPEHACLMFSDLVDDHDDHDDQSVQTNQFLVVDTATAR